jgi:hypothetical protein
MQLYLKRILIVMLLVVMLAFSTVGCAKYALIKKETRSSIFFEQDQKSVQVDIKKFIDIRPKEEKEGLTARTKKILSFASSDKDFKENIDEAITQRMKAKLEEKGFFTYFSTSERPKKYILEGEIKHFQVVMRLPNTTFVPYLGTAATIITKDEFNIAVSIKATLRDAQTNKILFTQVFDASRDLNLPTGILNLARFKRGISYRFKLLDKALDDVLEQIAQEINIAIQNEMPS